ncbi:hypothetical protein ABPG75_008949 [Micractinium tetrahymenae]
MASLAPGTVLGGRYEVQNELNRGGTAVVYRARDPTSGCSVAVKVITAGGRVPAAAIKREISIAAGLQGCPYVVQLLDFFAEGQDQAVLVWELVEGPDLLDLLNEHGGRMQEPAAAHYFAQLVRGVQYLHERQLCHRDLKPENVLVERSTGRLRIIDFGLSKRQASAVTLGVGTIDYLAPEMLRGGDVRVLKERTVGSYDPAKVDIWSMGVLLYLLVAGWYPFEDPACPHNVARTLMNIAAGTFRHIPRDVSPACADLIRSMLVVDPAARPSLDAILAHPWLAAAAAASADGASDAEEADEEEDMEAEAAEPSAAAGSSSMEVDAPAALHSSAGAGAQHGSQQTAAAAAAVLAQLGSEPELAAQQRPLEAAAAGASLGCLDGAAPTIGSRAASVSESAELPASIGAYPVQQKRTFSFHMGGAQEGGKAAPATPRVVSLAAAAGTAGPKAPAQHGPPSRGGGTSEESPRPRFGLAAFLCGFLWG